MGKATEKKQSAKAKSASSGVAARAGLALPPSKFNAKMKRRNVAKSIGTTSSVYIAGVMQFLASEILEQASEHAAKAKPVSRKRVSPIDVSQAIRQDADMDRLFRDVVMLIGDPVRNVHTAVLSKGDLALRAELAKARREAKTVPPSA